MLALQNKYLPHYVYEDYIQWEGQWELINGVPYAMAPQSSMYHQSINLRIASHLQEALNKCALCEVYIPIDWKIAEDTIVQPDISVVCKPFDENAAYLSKTPDIVFEILSPSTANKDRNLKYDLYESIGVKYYVIVNPVTKSAEVFMLDNGAYISKGVFNTGAFHFTISGCEIDFDFEKIW